MHVESDGEQAEEMIMEMPGQDYTKPLRERYASLAALLGVEGDDQVVLATPLIDIVGGLPSIPAE